jgi:NADH-quinone oxidoreductase subunit J
MFLPRFCCFQHFASSRHATPCMRRFFSYWHFFRRLPSGFCSRPSSWPSLWKHFPLAGAAGAIIALEMSYVLMGGFREPPQSASVPAAGDIAAQLSNTKELGKLLYSQYIYPLEVAAVILLVGMIAAIAMTLRERKDSKRTNPADQVRVKAADRIKLVKMESVLAAPVAVEEKKA